MQDGRLSKRVQMEGRNKTHSLVTGNITWGMLWFAVPMILGNLLQQFYNIADTLIVGRFLGAKALAAVGSAYTLMIFLTSVLLGLCMGSGVVFSLQYGARDHEALKRSIFVSLVLIGVITLLLNIAVFVWIDPILRLLQVPAEVYILMRDYLWIIFGGIGFTFLYNYYASLLRAVGNSVLPLVFLAVAVVLNIVLDLVFILYFGWGVRGAALATVIASAAMFLLFQNIRIRSDYWRRWVFRLAPLSFGVYLLHDSDFTRALLWQLVDLPRFGGALLPSLAYLTGAVLLVAAAGYAVDAVYQRLYRLLRLPALETKLDALTACILQRIVGSEKA